MALTAQDILELYRDGKIDRAKASAAMAALSDPGNPNAATQEATGNHSTYQENNLRGRVLQLMGKEGKTENPFAGAPGGLTGLANGPIADLVRSGMEQVSRVPGNLGAGPKPTENMGGSYQRGIGPAIHNALEGAGRASAPAAVVAGAGAAAAAPLATAIGIGSGMLGQKVGEAGVKHLGPPMGFKPNAEDIAAGGDVGGVLGGMAPAGLKALISRTPKLSAAMEAAKTWQEKNKVFQQAQEYVQELKGKFGVADATHQLRKSQIEAAKAQVAPAIDEASLQHATLESQTKPIQTSVEMAKATAQEAERRGKLELKRLQDNAARMKNQPGYDAALRQAEVAQQAYDANIKLAKAKELHAGASDELNSFNKSLTADQVSALQRKSLGLKNEAASLQASGRTAPKPNPEVDKLSAQISETQKMLDEAHKAIGTTDPEVIKNSALGKIYERKTQELEALKAKLGALAKPTEGALATAGQRKAKVTDLKNAARNNDQLTRDVRAGVEESPVEVAPEKDKLWQNLAKKKSDAEAKLQDAQIQMQAIGEAKNNIKLDLAKNRIAGVNPAETDAVDEILSKMAVAKDDHLAALGRKVEHANSLADAKLALETAPRQAQAAVSRAEAEAARAAEHRDMLGVELSKVEAEAAKLHPGDAPAVPLSTGERLKKAALSQVLPAAMGAAGAASGIPHAEGIAGLVGEIPAIVSAFQKGPTRTAANMPPISTPTPPALREMLMKRLEGTGVNTSALGALLPGYLDNQPQE